MGAYIIQVICFQALFLAVYYVLLRKETFFTYNRIYLLIAPVLSFIIPFVKITSLQTMVPQEVMITMLPEVIIGASTTTENIAQAPEIAIPWMTIYLTGCMVSLLVLVFKIRKFATFLAYKEKENHIIEVPESTEAFTFFNYIFIGKEIDTLSRKQILTHEQIHVTQRHTWDLVFFELLRVVLWFNPLVYVFQKQISIVHEYLADQKATAAISKKAYYEELLNTAFGTSNLSFTNTFFNKSLIKNRIIMLQKSKSKRSALIKYTLIVPLILAMLIQVSWAQGTDLALGNEKDISKENLILSKVGDSNTEDEDSYYFLQVIEREKLNNNEQNFLKELESKEIYKTSTLKDKEPGNPKNRTTSVGGFKGSVLVSDLIKKYRIKEYSSAEYKKFSNIGRPQGLRSSVVATFDGEVVEFQETLDIPYAVIEKVPTYPGCESLTSNDELKKCMSDKVSQYVNSNFNVNIAKPLGLTGVNRVFVAFRINKNGQADNVRVRAPHPDLEEEARRVIYNLPQMEPGEQKGEPVGVLYSIPISFQVM